MIAFEDSLLTLNEKKLILLSNIYNLVPDNVEEAVGQAITFLNLHSTGSGNDNELRLFSFSKDSGFIFAAFKQTHDVDLDQVQMHWFKFMTLFMDLGSETAFCSLTTLRKRVKTGKATKEEKMAARELGDVFEISELDLRSLEEREREINFMRLFEQGKHGHNKEN